ncbi:DUF1573 domain-containing protein [bacterium]|nr:DUF1573 domain-containing protein [bacterium]
MKRILFIAISLILIFFSGCEKGGMEPRANGSKAKKVKVDVSGPVLDFSQLEYDFGQIKPAEKVRHDFKFRNTGKETLNIINIRSSCGCTTVKLQKREYAPGEEGVITASFDPKNFQGDTVKTISIKSNDPLRETIVLKIKAHILVDIVVRPKLLHFRDMIIGQPRTVNITLQGAEIDRFKIKEVKVPEKYPFFETSVEELTNSKRSIYHIKVTCDPDANSAETFSDHIRIFTDSKKKPVINIPVRGSVKGEINYAPSSVAVNFSKGAFINSTISIKSPNVFEIENISFKGESGALKYKLITLSARHNYSLLLYTEEPLNETIRSTLIIKTSSKFQSEIRIPVNLVKR